MRRARGSAGRPLLRAVPALLLIPLVWLAVSDIPTGIRVGPLSLSGLATLTAGAAAVVLAPALVLHGRGGVAPQRWDLLVPQGRRQRVVPLALIGFCAVVLVGLARTPTQSGIQQSAVYLAFTAAIAYAALYSRADTADRYLQLLGVVMGLTALVAIPLFALDAAPWGSRSFALAAIIAIAALVPYRSRNPLVRLAPYLLTVAVAISLSRTALAIAVLLLAFAVLRSRRGLRGARIAVALAALMAAAVVAFLAIPSLRDRFTEGDNSVVIGGVPLNTSGRSEIWALVFQDGLRSPWFGHGAGTASEVVNARYPFVGQPHNDYLRVWHDFGLLGLGLLLAALAVLVAGAVQRALRTEPEHRAIHWSATLALLSFVAAAATDNPIIYPFVMLPLGVIVGLSIARRGLHPLQPRAAATPVDRGRLSTGRSFVDVPALPADRARARPVSAR